MVTPLTVIQFVGGLAAVIYFAEKLVDGTVGTARGFGLSAFLVSVVFVGFDPENLFVGTSGTYEGVAGIALGAIVGAAMVAIALAFGITALLAPMEFEEAPTRILVVQVLAVLLFGGVALDGRLSRLDGGVLLLGYVVAVGYLLWLGERGVDVLPGEEPESEPDGDPQRRWKAVGLFAVSLVAIVAGSELLVASSETIIETLGVTDTFFGLIVLAALVSIEELARELPAALRGRPEITFGNVVGSVMAFFLFNAGVIALVDPVPVPSQVLGFYLPIAIVTVLLVSGFMLRKRVRRRAGGVLVLLYLVFAVGGYAIASGFVPR
ncbi:sodium:calcium antiporter [Halorarum salinum]|uniref:Sodium:calcium antiporter n=1 Tax=Halorarum salinum TaxID=2743089 RepID=A0A7D5LA08_9EURY|nr:sodium:calcium antiporter [Halobaculum salinum]QLG61249.1 sodium:calcium antiporter [Halobaculum salinum]